MNFEQIEYVVKNRLAILTLNRPEKMNAPALELITRLGLDPAKTVQGDCEIVFQRPVCAGECLRCEIVIGNISEK